MGENIKQKEKDLENEGLEIVEGELVETSSDEAVETFEEETIVSAKREGAIAFPAGEQREKKPKDSRAWLQYIVVPLIFLLVTLLGGLRLGAVESEFLFLKPALICLIFATILLVLFFRARLLRLNGWFSEDFAPLQNTANACVLLTLFAASTQVFNSLLPEQGLPFWIIAFFFLWSLWTNLFAEFDTRKLLISLGSLFGLAFITKYLILSSLTAPGNGGFIEALFSGNLTKETITYLLDLPRFSAGTGYIQFFTLIFYLIGLFLLAPTTNKG
ncbi:MAG: hypothetical protein R2747_10065 [Pyrinomonadaceae bacterium]